MHHRKLNRSLFTAGLSLASLVLVAACSKTPSSEPPPATAAAAEQPVVSEGKADPAAAHATPPGAPAELGKPAPDFTLKSVDGKDFTLSALKGKTVVLEWFNPECPFVKASHTVGSLKGLAGKYVKDGDVQWLAINSGAAGKQGAGEDANKAGIEKFGIDYPVLIDSTGSVGKQYGAERTPHIFVINPEGTLVYRGAIDNSPDGEGKSPEGGKLVNYVDTTLAALKTGAKVEPAETKAYGCGVKYND